MVIVAGRVYVDSKERDRHVASFMDMIQRARDFPGCLDFTIAADPIEADRVNMFERFESEESLAAWRAVANSPEPVAEMLSVDVQKHQVSASGPPFDE